MAGYRHCGKHAGGSGKMPRAMRLLWYHQHSLEASVGLSISMS
jgi:hypothetical protein